MALEYKRKSKLDLLRLPVLIEDTSLNSTGYFNITEFPSYFGSGKNLIRLKGNTGNLLQNSPIYVEILDTNGDTLYYELPNFSEKDLTRYISAWVYNDELNRFNTPNGIGKVIICGTAQTTRDGVPVPTQWKNNVNVRWTRDINITREKKSPSKIVFLGNDIPTVSFEEVTNFYKKVELLSGSILITTQSYKDTGSFDLSPILVSYDYNANRATTGNVRSNTYSPYQTIFPKLTFRKIKNLAPTLGAPITASLVFAENLFGKMTGGTIEINLSQSSTAYNSIRPDVSDVPNDITIPTKFTASILTIDDYSNLSITSPMTASSYAGDTERNRIYFTEFKDAEWVIKFVSTGSYSDSPFENPTIFVNVKNINPMGGNVNKVVVYYRPSFNVSDYEFGGSTEIFNNEDEVSFYVNVKNFRRNTSYDFKVEFENIEETASDTVINKYDFLIQEAIMGSPAPPDKSIQYNNLDAFEGSYDLAYDYNYENVGIGTYNPTYKLDIFNELGFNVDGEIYTLLRSGSNHIYVGGRFERYLGEKYNGIIRLDLTGSIDRTFNPGGGFKSVRNSIPYVTSIKFASGSSDIYVGGNFVEYSGSKDVNYFARIGSDGTLKSNFSEHGKLNNIVNTIYVSNETPHTGSVYIGGAFTEYSGSALRILKLDPTGSLIKYFTGKFDTGSNTQIFSIESFDANNGIFVAGNFIAYSGSNDYQYGNSGILKINKSGSIITQFNQSGSINGGTSGSNVYTIHNPNADDLWIGGMFDKYSGSAAYKIAKIDKDTGALDDTWIGTVGGLFFGLTNSVRTINRLDDDFVLVGGYFNPLSGGEDTRIKRLVLLSETDGQPYDSNVSGRNLINDGGVLTSLKLDDSNVMIGGNFNQYRTGYKLQTSNGGRLINSDKIIILDIPTLHPSTGSYYEFFNLDRRNRDPFFISSSMGTFIGSESVLWPQISNNPFIIKNSGDVGIGTINPNERLHVEGGVIARLPKIQQPWTILYDSQSGLFTYGTSSGATGPTGPPGPSTIILNCQTITATGFNPCRLPNESDEYNLTFGFTVQSPISNDITVISASLFSGSSQIWGVDNESRSSLPITWTIPTSSIGNVNYTFVVTASYTSEYGNPNAWARLKCNPTSFNITQPYPFIVTCQPITTTPLLGTTGNDKRHNRETASYAINVGFTHNNPYGVCSPAPQLNVTLISASLHSGSLELWKTGSINYVPSSPNTSITFGIPSSSFGQVSYTFRVTASISESRFDSTTWAMCSSTATFSPSPRDCPNTYIPSQKPQPNSTSGLAFGFKSANQLNTIITEMGDSGSITIETVNINTSQPAWEFIGGKPTLYRYLRDNNQNIYQDLSWTSTTTQNNIQTANLTFQLTGSLSGSLGNDNFVVSSNETQRNIGIPTTSPLNNPWDELGVNFQQRSYLRIWASSSFSSSRNPSGVPHFNLNDPPIFCNNQLEVFTLFKTISIRSGSFFEDDFNQVMTTESIYDLRRWDTRTTNNSLITGSVGFDLTYNNGITPNGSSTPQSNPLFTIGYLGSSKKREYFIVNRNIEIAGIWDSTIPGTNLINPTNTIGFAEYLIGHYAAYVRKIPTTHQLGGQPKTYYVYCKRR